MARMAKAERPRRAWPGEAVERWPLDKIQPYPRNMRTHTPAQVKQIADSMERFGVTTPVLVDEAGELIFGHGRYRAAQDLKLDYLPVSVARGWTEAEKKAYRITDNQIALNAGWDTPLLEAEVKGLKLEGFDLNLLGFGDAQ